MKWTAANIPDQTGRVAIVTGGNSGIGFETARALANCGADVVLACRSADKAAAAQARILDETPAARVKTMALDLSDLDSVRAFTTAFSAARGGLDLLVNNAGVMAPPLTKTGAGLELQFATNHLGHFALTGLLLPLFRDRKRARVVNVSSLMHRSAKIDFDNLNAEKSYGGMKTYGVTKLANLLFTFELQRRLAAGGHAATSLASHPGATRTELQRHFALARWAVKLMSQEPVDGALPSLYAATATDAAGGDYYGPDGAFELKGGPAKAKVSRGAQDAAAAATLWARSQELTKVSYLS